MITAVDSNILLDVFRPDPVFGPLSREALRGCRLQGSLVACDIVWAEIGAFFALPAGAQAAMEKIVVEFSAVDRRTALAASEAWKSYRNRGGKRERMIADFLIGSHAACQADRLLTRDRGFYRSYFSRLQIVDPSENPKS